MSGAPGSGRFGLYVHIPFCASKCAYCDFASRRLGDVPPKMRARIAEDLAEELTLAARRFPQLVGRHLDTVYFGGGTPSLLAPEELARILEAISGTFVLSRDLEQTIECNPGTTTPETWAELRALGFTRVSLGVQSFRRHALRTLERGHSPEDARRALHEIAGAGFASWGLDLIYGVPERGGADPRIGWEQDLGEATEWEPPHLSIYGLTYPEGTRLRGRLERGEVAAVGEEAERAMFLRARRFLRERGWGHYEISNYAKPGHESRHNALYWTPECEYLGLGVGAHSFLDGVRFANPAEPLAWREAVAAQRWPGAAEDPPSEAARRGERIMLALRRVDGISTAALSAWIGTDFETAYAGPIDRLRESGLLELDGGTVRLSEEGLLLSDGVFEAFF